MIDGAAVSRHTFHGRIRRPLELRPKLPHMLKIATKFAPHPAGFETAWQAGFRFAEFWLNGDWLQRVDDIIHQAKQYPLRYVPHLPNKHVQEITIQQTVQLYQQLDCQALVLHQPMMDLWGHELRAQCPGIRLAVENHILNEKEFWHWAESNPGLNLDVEHFWMFTLKDAPLARLEKTLVRFLENHSGRLNHVHLPGYVPGYEEHRPMYCSRELMFLVWDLLEQHAYAGFVVSEVDSAYQTPQDLRMDLLLFERWWTSRAAAGIQK